MAETPRAGHAEKRSTVEIVCRACGHGYGFHGGNRCGVVAGTGCRCTGFQWVDPAGRAGGYDA